MKIGSHLNQENALFKISLSMGTFRHFDGDPCIFFIKKRIELTGRGLIHSLSHHRYDIHWQGSIEVFQKISEIWRFFPIPTGLATDAGRNPGSVTKSGINLCCKIDLKVFQKSKSTKNKKIEGYNYVHREGDRTALLRVVLVFHAGSWRIIFPAW